MNGVDTSEAKDEEMATKERLSETIAFRVTPKIYQFLNGLADRERRKMSEIATALLERGIAAYERDRELFEPKSTTHNVSTRLSVPKPLKTR